MTIHDLFRLAMALADEYAHALRTKFPSDAAYIHARYLGSGDAQIEALAARQQAACDAWTHACRRLAL